MNNLRVWHIQNPPNHPMHWSVSSVEEARQKIQKLIQLDLKNTRIVSNAFGLEIQENDEWSEWYNDEGQDIMELVNDGD